MSQLYLFGKYPKNVHLFIKRYKLSDIPQDKEAFKKWIYKVWEDKDELLKQFYIDGKFESLDRPLIKSFKISFYELFILVWFGLFPWILYFAITSFYYY